MEQIGALMRKNMVLNEQQQLQTEAINRELQERQQQVKAFVQAEQNCFVLEEIVREIKALDEEEKILEEKIVAMEEERAALIMDKVVLMEREARMRDQPVLIIECEALMHQSEVLQEKETIQKKEYMILLDQREPLIRKHVALRERSERATKDIEAQMELQS